MLKYNLDITPESEWIVVTPSAEAREILMCVVEAGDFHSGSDYFVERSGKNEYVLGYTRSGSAILKHKGQESKLVAGSAVVMHCDEYHSIRAGEDGWDHFWVSFCGGESEKYYNLINDDVVLPVQISDCATFEKCFETISSSPGVNNMRQSVLLSMCLAQMLSMLVIARYEPRNEKLYIQHYDKIIASLNYIKENYTKQISLDDFTDVVGLSKCYFLKLFKQFTGMSPYEYVINYRINQAKFMLRTSDMTVAEVGAEVGFCDESNFIKKFKNSTGTTPLSYRKIRMAYPREIANGGVD